MRHFLTLLLTLLFFSCGQSVKIKDYWKYDVRATDAGWEMIDTTNLSKERICFKSGDKAVVDSLINSVSAIENSISKELANVIREQHSDKIFIHEFKDGGSTIFKTEDAILSSMVYEFNNDSYTVTTLTAGLIEQKTIYQKIKGELTGIDLVEPINEFIYDWNIKENISADVTLGIGEDLWGYPRHRWKVVITNISGESLDRSFDIMIKFYNREHQQVGTLYSGVRDFLMRGEAMSKSIYLSRDDNDMNCFCAEYSRLYINGVYFGEFNN